MFFKNLTIYRMTKGWQLSATQVEESIAAHSFTPIGAVQESSSGWEEIFGEGFVHTLAGQMMLQFKSEKRKVPGSAIKAEVRKRIESVEQQTGRKPGKKERRDIKEDALLALLPQVLPTHTQTRVWIDPSNGWIVINTGSASVADAIITALIRALDKLQLQTLHIARSPASVMTEWLANQSGPTSFSIDRACELKANDETKAVVKYKNAFLDTNDIKDHIRMGKSCTRLALTFDDRVSFVITEKFTVKSIAFLDGVFENHESAQGDTVDQFNSDFALMTGELTKMLNALVEAFGGEAPRVDDQGNDDLF